MNHAYKIRKTCTERHSDYSEFIKDSFLGVLDLVFTECSATKLAEQLNKTANKYTKYSVHSVFENTIKYEDDYNPHQKVFEEYLVEYISALRNEDRHSFISGFYYQLPDFWELKEIEALKLRCSELFPQLKLTLKYDDETIIIANSK